MKQHLSQQSSGVRKGSLIIEMVVCTVLLSVVTAVMVPGIYAVHQQRIATRYETLTLIELNNLAAQLTHQSDRDLTVSDWFHSRYPEVSLTVSEIASDDDSRLKTFRLTLTRTRPGGHPDVNRSLVVWKPQETAE